MTGTATRPGACWSGHFVVPRLARASASSAGAVLIVRGGILALVSPQPVVARILELTGADQIIPVYGTLQDAQTAD